jgi:hypothetical protein
VIARLAGLAALVVVLAGAVVAVVVARASIGPGEGHQAPVAVSARQAAGGPLAVGRPEQARRVGRAPQALLELRAPDPQGGTGFAITVKRVRRERARPAAWRDVLCLDVVRADRVARRRFRASGGCRPASGVPDEVSSLLFASTATMDGPVRMSGFAPEGTRRMTVAGLGPTAELPVGRHGAWFLAVAGDVRATLTVTAELRDGTTRFQRLRVPSGPVPPDAPEARDPVDGSSWAVSSAVRNGGDRKGQTCVQFFNLGANGREQGFGAPMCGDLRRQPLFVDALERGPGPQTKFGGGPDVAPRLVVWGAASTRVRALELTSPDGSRPVPIAEEGRGFIAVLPGSVRRADVTLRATLADGTTRELRAPDRVGVAPLTRTPLRRTQPLRAVVQRSRSRILLTLGVLGDPDRVKVVFQHHAVYLGAVPGKRGLYAGALRYRNGVPARHRPGRRFRAYSVICAPGCKDTDESGVLR